VLFHSHLFLKTFGEKDFKKWFVYANKKMKAQKQKVVQGILITYPPPVELQMELFLNK
jgi:hypothetical protein